MTSKSALLRSAAIGVMMTVSFAASAQAATHKRVVRANPAAAANRQLMDQVQALSAQVQALQSRLDAQAQAQQAVQAQVAATQSAVAETQTQVQQVVANSESVEDRLENVPQTVLQTLGEVPKPKPSWAESTSVSGRMYFDLTSVSQKSNGVKVPVTGVGFDIKRFYIGVDHKFNDTYSANVTTDFQYSSAISSTELYLKKAFLKANYAPYLQVRLGADDLPWIPFAEGIYGYRHIEQTLTDRTKFGTSSDWGLHVGGALGQYVQYEVAVIDGAGYKAPLRSKTMDVEGRINLNYQGFVLAVGGYSGKLGKDTQGVTNVFHTASRFNALAAYVKGPYRLGVEYFSASNWNTITTVAADKSEGYSVFGSYAVNPEWSLFGRYDWVKPTKTSAPTRKENYFNVGIQYEPVKIVDLSLVYKRDKLEKGSLSTGNGTIGGSIDGTYDEIGLFGQVRF
ncbi:MAG TPA: hypothetical protein VL358_03585 [Caulobacteraceae bacterium]|jgi:hypothetical protein|nr:hypothetical protein [Caulobacteraceae bacterium]